MKQPPFTIDDLKKTLASHECRFVGNPAAATFETAKTLADADQKSISWISGTHGEAAGWAGRTRAGVLVCKPALDIPPDALRDKCFVLTEKPKLIFSIILEALFVEKPRGVHPTAWVHPEARLAGNVYIGPFTYVGKCIVGEDSLIWGHCYLHDDVTIGRSVEIHAGCIIGDDGSGYAKNDAGEWIKFPHIGGLIIEDRVEIGANSYINKGALGNTHLKRGAKIGNAVCIGHNVVIEENAIVIANTLVAGSSTVGKGAYIAPAATIRNKLTIGANATVGMGAVVLKDVPPNTTVIGNPAMEMGEYRRWTRLKKKLFDLFGANASDK